MGIARPVYQMITTIEKKVAKLTDSKENGNPTPWESTWRSIKVSQETERSGEKVGQQSLLWFPPK